MRGRGRDGRRCIKTGTMMTTIDDNDEGDGGGDDEDLVLPARSELDEMTLTAFEIPGYGEYFLRELQHSGDVGLDGLF